MGALVAAVVAGLLLLSAGDDEPAPATRAALSDEQLAGQRIITGFTGTKPPQDLVRMIREGEVAGVVLFERNLSSDSAAAGLISRLTRIPQPEEVDEPLIVAVDQEGGQVKRLDGPPSSSAAEMGVAGAGDAGAEGSATGRYLAGLGFNLNLAPTLDVATPGAEIDSTQRAFSADPREVAEIGGAFAEGLEEEGVASTAKHFPGFGRAESNTDDRAQTIDVSVDQLRVLDEVPFKDFVEDGGRVVMLSNAVYPALDPDLPSGLSADIATGELREALGFEGVSVTDSLDAEATKAIGSPARLATLGAKAGTDLLLFTSLESAILAHESLVEGLTGGSLERSAFEDSAARVLEFRSSLRD